MAQQALNRSMEGRIGSRAVRVSRSSSLRCKALNVQHQAQGPPPAWDKRVVVPEVQPRDTPKVCEVGPAMLAGQLGAASGQEGENLKSGVSAAGVQLGGGAAGGFCCC